MTHFRSAIALLAALAGAAARGQSKPVDPLVDPLAALRAQPIEPRVEAGHAIRVVDENARALTDASVTVYCWRDVPEDVRREFGARATAKQPRASTWKLLAHAAVFGRRYATDEQGIARIPLAGSGDLVGIRGNRVGLGRMGHARELVLHPIRTLHVLVEDHRGKPAPGVPLGIRSGAQEVSGFPPQTTDAQGRAALRLIVFEDHRVWRVEPALPLAHTPRVTIDQRTIATSPERPIRLRLPPSGTVRVYVTDPDGKPIKDLDGVHMVAWEPTIVMPGQRWEAMPAARIEDEVATFPFVEVGFDGEVSAVVGGAERPARLRFPGPRHPGEVRALALAGVVRKPVLSLHVVAPDGTPLGGARVHVILASSEAYEVMTREADARGHLSVPVPDALEKEPRALVTVVAERGPARLAKQLRNVDLRASRPLGELRLAAEPVVLAGRVLDPSGQPIAGAVVSLAERYGDVRAAVEEGGAQRGFPHRAITDGEGSFAFRAAAVPSALHLRVADEAGNELHVVEGARLPAGKQDAVVIAQRTAAVHGRIGGLAEHGQLPVEVRLVPGGGSDWMRPAPGGRFTFASCPGGLHRFEVQRKGGAKPLLTVPEVRVEPGVACRDPRLQDIDLTAVLACVAVRVLGPGGLPLQSISLRVGVGGRAERETHFTDREGVAWLPAPGQAAEVVVWDRFRNFQVRVLPLREQAMTVELQPVRLLHVRVRNLPPLHPRQRLSAHVKEDALPAPPREWWYGESGLDPGAVFQGGYGFADPTVTIQVPVTGRHLLRVGAQWFRFEVGREREQRLELELDDDAIRRLREEAAALDEQDAQRNARAKQGR